MSFRERIFGERSSDIELRASQIENLNRLVSKPNFGMKSSDKAVNRY